MNKGIFLAALLGACGGLLGYPASAQHGHHTESDRPSADLIAEAIAAPGRRDSARALDESRRPADVLTWAGLEPGMDAADLIPGEGYWTEIMAQVVGAEGSLVALQPEQFYNEPEAMQAWAELLGRAPAARMVRYPFEAFAYPPDSLDLALINMSYHDLYWESAQYSIPRTDPDAYLRTLFAAMRPGASVVVIDHVGPAGDTREVVERLHRIDPAVVLADFERAGFVLADRSDLLANPADDHSLLVFDPAIRFQTDRFMFRFTRPAG